MRPLASQQCGLGWVCCLFSSLLQEVFLRVLRFSPLLKNQHFQILVRSGTHGHVSTSSYEFLNAHWVNKLHITTTITGFYLGFTVWGSGRRRHAPRKVFEMNVRWDAIWCIWDAILRNDTVCLLLGPFHLDKFQKIWAVIWDLAIFLLFSICSVNFDILCSGSFFHQARLYSFTFVQWNLDITNLCATESSVSKKNTVYFTLVIVKYVKKYLDITKPRYSEHILPVHWPFVISRFHCTQIFTRLVCLNGKHTW